MRVRASPAGRFRLSAYDARMQPHFTGTCLITDDVPALADFYAAVLDAEVQGGDPFARVTVPGAVLSFFSIQGMESMVPGAMAAAANGGFTLEFQVTDVEACHERLQAQGLEILKPAFRVIQRPRVTNLGSDLRGHG